MLPTEDITLALSHPAMLISKYGYINDPNQPHLGNFKWELWPWQLELLDIFTREHRVAVLKARQLGCSWLFAGYALWTFLAMPGSVTVLISRREDEAAALLSKVVFLYEHLPPEFHFPRNKRKDKDSDTTFTSHTLGSKIIAVPATPDAARGLTATLVIPDEWAYQDYAAEMFASYDATVGMGGKIIGGSTASGPSGFFYDLWQSAKKPAGNFLPVFLPWYLRPGRTREWYEDKRREYHEQGRDADFSREFPEDELDAFMATLSNFFPRETTRDILAKVAQPNAIEMNGDLRIYKRPRATSRYAIGVDVAEGLMHGDYSTAVVIDAGSGEHVASFRSHTSPDLFAIPIAEIGTMYNNALVAVESNNHGLATINVLKSQLYYPNLFHQPTPDRPAPLSMRTATPVTTGKIGWTTNSRTKPEMLLAFRTALSDGGFSTHCQWLASELPYFTEKKVSTTRVDYNAESGHHDDMIIAAAIAWAVQPYARPKARRMVERTPSLSR
ncbi:MAG: hypothetical protein JW384_01720 [Nitrosomonadaceae bacterium]|nr:hypothetical protein [Nitrosomonadaceae bacterium]